MSEIRVFYYCLVGWVRQSNLEWNSVIYNVNNFSLLYFVSSFLGCCCQNIIQAKMSTPQNKSVRTPMALAVPKSQNTPRSWYSALYLHCCVLLTTFRLMLHYHRWRSWAIHRSSQTVWVWWISSRGKLSLSRWLCWPWQAVIRDDLFTAGIQN